jgi:hypothetical protein
VKDIDAHAQLIELRSVMYQLTKAVAEHMNNPLGHIYSGTMAPGDQVYGLRQDMERQRFRYDGIEAPE